jgi:hypothetical protein
LETAIIKKRLRTFMSPKGSLASVSNEVALEVLRGWESWTGPGAEFARELGISHSQLGTMIQKGKNLIKKGIVTESEFKELSVPTAGAVPVPGSSAIELRLENGRVVGFSQVEMLIDFMKKYS